MNNMDPDVLAKMALELEQKEAAIDAEGDVLDARLQQQLAELDAEADAGLKNQENAERLKNLLLAGVGGLGALGVVGLASKAAFDALTQTPAAMERAATIPSSPLPTKIMTAEFGRMVAETPGNKSTSLIDLWSQGHAVAKKATVGLVNGAPKDVQAPLTTLLHHIANGGDKNGQDIKGALTALAKAYSTKDITIDGNKLYEGYIKSRDAINLNGATPDPTTYEESIKAALAGVQKSLSDQSGGQISFVTPHTNPLAHLTDNIKQTFNNLINPDVKIASINTGVVSDMGNGIIPPQGVLSGLGQHLQHFAKTAQEAVGHAWNSEPVQSALHLVKENSHYLAAGSAAVMLITPAVKAAWAKQKKNSSSVPDATIQAKFQNALRVTKAVLTTKISVQDYAKQFNNPQTILAGVRTAGFALAAVSPAAAVVAATTSVAGISSLAARVVHAATKDKQGFEKIAAASLNVAEMKYLTYATAFAATTTKNLAANTRNAFTEQKQNLTQAFQETTKNVQHTMSNVQQTMAGLWHGMANRFKMA